MGKMTFVVEYEDGKEPPVSADMDVAGGRLVAASWRDYSDDFFTVEERDAITEMLEEAEWHDQVEEAMVEIILAKIELLTY